MRKLPILLSVAVLGAASLFITRYALADDAAEANKATASEANGEGAATQSGMDTAKPASGKAVKAKKHSKKTKKTKKTEESTAN